MTTAVPLPRVAVVFDFGSASPMSILASARDLARIVFLCDRSLPHVRALYDDLRALAPVCDTTGMTDEQIVAAPDCADLAGIVTFSESQLNRTAALADRRGLAFLSVDTAAAVTDKYTQRRVLAEAGVQHTACRVVRDLTELAPALDTVGLPAVLKPRSGAASARTCTVHSLDEAQVRWRAFTGAETGGSTAEFVVERLLSGDPSAAGQDWADYVSVESMTSHGDIRHVEVTGKFPLAAPLRETGYVVPSTLGDGWRDEVLALTTAALTALGVRHGITHTEVKLTPGGPRIIEVNGRLGGYVADLVRRARGFDLVRAALTVALGRPYSPPATAYRRHAFQYFLTPPMEAVALRRLDGIDELGDVPGIHLVEVLTEPGTALDWRRGTLAYLGIVHGSAPDHRGVLRLVDLIGRTLHVEYERAPESDENRTN
ncbi:ATP-grasp domain-containing protein [Actinoplanes sp. NEAU-A12]|uniref:ATP-grasp domain-containing protein n=1 Tax=Actinoplanes sandaracinus TaxID=3045177 RepID=A0ABT6WWV5_9ACTN|nr:ATP-grasp domain-containing protein [Actinoplanes sandaracinus]MDI6104229.1 ATP-grasp domain-containing protein [Actinoplanes sandaracinus]